jgi:branched-chain amino acid transport system substrate-binding protein
MLNAAHLALEDFRKKHLLDNYSIELLPLDDQARAEKAEETARRFSADPDIIAVIGHKNSECAKAAGSVYNNAGLVAITPSATGFDLTRQGWSNFYRLCASDLVQGKGAATFAAEDLQVKRVLVVRDETDYGRSLATQFYEFYSAIPGTESKIFQITQGSRNFDDLFNEVDIYKPGLIYMALTEIESAQMAVEVSKRNLKILLLGADGSKNSKFPDLAGIAAHGAYMTYAGATSEQNSSGKDFLIRYEKSYGPAPVYGAETYDAARIILQTMLNDREIARKKVADRFKSGLTYMGVSGEITFTSSGERENAAVSVWKVKNTEMQLIKVMA